MQQTSKNISKFSHGSMIIYSNKSHDNEEMGFEYKSGFPVFITDCSRSTVDAANRSNKKAT